MFVWGSRPAQEQEQQWCRCTALHTAIAELDMGYVPLSVTVPTSVGNRLLTQPTGTTRGKTYLSEDCSQVI